MVVAATPTPQPLPEVKAATSEPAVAAVPELAPELAPPGVFYLIEAVRVETEHGIVGLKPGTGVKLVRPGIYLTPDGELPLRPEQMTNDMRLARQAATMDAATQARVKAQLAAQAQAAKAAQAERDSQPLATPSPSAAPAVSAVPMGSRSPLGGTGLAAPPGGLGQTHSNTKDKVYTDSQGKRYWRDAQGRHRYDF
jgi:hypothetical protein